MRFSIALIVILNLEFARSLANSEPEQVLRIIKLSESMELQKLLTNGLDPNTEVPIGNTTEPMVIAACIYSDVATVKVLLENGASPEATSLNHRSASPVELAMQRGKPEMAELLIRSGANSNGVTPLMIAIMRGDIAAASKEIADGADLNAVTGSGHSTFSFAHPIADCVQFLIKRGARHSYSETELATMLGDEKTIREELDKGQASRTTWKSEVRWAIFYDRPGILDLILSKVPGVGSEEFEFRTPVALAAERGRFECLRVLIRRNADINGLSEGIFSPIELARRNGHLMCVRQLIAAAKSE